MPAALITGGAGFIGSHLTRRFVELGWQVDVLDDLSRGDERALPDGATLHRGDVRSHSDVEAAFGARRFDLVVHCAAQTSVQRSMRQPDEDYAVNVGGTRNLLEATKRHAAGRFVFLSSAGGVYGETSTPAGESTHPSPSTYYGLHKLAAEAIVRAAGLPYAVLRPANVYGPGQRADAEGGVISIFAARLASGEPISVYGDGTQVRDFVYVSDVVEAVQALVETEAGGVWNVGTGTGTSVIELARTLARLTGRELRLEHLPARPGDVASSVVSAKALLATGAWGPPRGLIEGLTALIAARDGASSG